jgi:hypothetical protein
MKGVGFSFHALTQFADVGFEGLVAAVVAAAQVVFGGESEKPLDLVQPGGVGGGEMHVEAWMRLQPIPDDRGFVVW